MPDDAITPWSAVRYEERPWTPAERSLVPRRAWREQVGPYQAAVVPPIAEVRDLGLADDTLALAEEASVEIARFDAEVGTELAPFASLLLRSESVASSQVEHLTASAKAIALAELGDRSRRNATIIVANTRAMEAAIALADRLDERAILDVHEALLGDTHPAWVGRWRDQQVWIGGSNYGPRGAIFVPPHHDRVPEAMTDLVAFLQRDDLPALAQAAIAHAQFETVHPFPDGNGRVGRALVHSLLQAKRLTRAVTVPVSAGLLADVDGYFASLTAYREGRPAEIVEGMAHAAFLALANGRQLVEELGQIRSSWDRRIVARSDATAWKVADLLVRQPVVDSQLLQREIGVTAASANHAIEQLVAVEVLTKVHGDQRYRKWGALEVLDALDAFALRAGHRTSGGSLPRA